MSHTERRKYLTDLTDDQWQIFRPLFPAPSASRCSPKGLPPRDHQCDLLCGEEWLPLAAASTRIPQLEDGLRHPSAMAQRRHVANDSRLPSRQAPPKVGPKGLAERGDYRQSDGEDDRGRWRARLRREQEGHWSQAARGRGYIGFDSGRSRSRCKYSGPGRRSAPASGPGSIAFPFWQTQSHLCRQRLCEKWFACPSEDIVRLVDSNRTSTRGAQGIHCAAKTLDRGTNLRLAGPVSSPQQRLRAEHRVERIDDRYRNDSLDRPTNRNR